MSSEAGGAGDFLERASALGDFGRADDAIAELRRGLAEYPQDPDLLGLLAWLLFFNGGSADIGADSGAGGERAAEAERAAKDVLAARPHDWRGLTVLCEIAVQRGLPDEALAHAAAQCEHYPDWSGGHLNVAYALLGDERGSRAERKQRRAEIRASLDRALELAPENVETLRRVAIMLRRIDDPQGSSDVLDRALQLDPVNQDLLLLAAERVGGQPDQTVHGLGAVSAKNEAEALRLLSGVLAENPDHRGAARAISDQVWFRTQLLATLPLWLFAALMLFAYLVFGEPISTSSRTRVKGAEAFLMVPMAWLLLFISIRRKGLPKRFMRRLYKPVWWVWIGLAIAALGGLAMIFFALAMFARSGEAMLALQGSYVGGITRGIGFVAWFVLIGELLIVFARFRSERVAGLAVADAEGVAAARAELRTALWGLIRTGVAVVLALVPVFAAPIATRPEAAGGFAAVALALGAPPIVTLALRLGRWSGLRRRMRNPEGRGSSAAVVAYALAAVTAILAAVGAWLLADRHAGEYDPPPTPQQIEMQERQHEISEITQRLRETTRQLENALPPSTQ